MEAVLFLDWKALAVAESYCKHMLSVYGTWLRSWWCNFSTILLVFIKFFYFHSVERLNHKQWKTLFNINLLIIFSAICSSPTVYYNVPRTTNYRMHELWWHNSFIQGWFWSMDLQIVFIQWYLSINCGRNSPSLSAPRVLLHRERGKQWRKLLCLAAFFFFFFFFWAFSQGQMELQVLGFKPMLPFMVEVMLRGQWVSILLFFVLMPVRYIRFFSSKDVPNISFVIQIWIL